MYISKTANNVNNNDISIAFDEQPSCISNVPEVSLSILWNNIGVNTAGKSVDTSVILVQYNTVKNIDECDDSSALFITRSIDMDDIKNIDTYLTSM